MTRVLVIGATGYLGNAVASALVRADHEVYGLARTEEKARELAVQEVFPVMGSDQDSDHFLEAIKEKNIDVVIDTSNAMYGTSPLLRYVITAGVDRLGTALSEAKHAVPTQKLGFIYTSCMWVHGHNPLQTVGDTDPVGVPSAKAAAAGIVGWRPALERDILAARSILDVVILRPAMMYGRSSGIWGTLLFGPILAGVMNGSASVRLVASKDCNVSTAHVDDVATAFVGAVERIHMLAGNGSNSGGILPIFNLQTGYENIGTIVDSAARMFGYGGAIEYASVAEEPFSEAAFGTSINADSSRARAILGWQPSRLAGLVGGMSIYGYAFAAVGDAPAVLAAIAAAKAKGAVP